VTAEIAAVFVGLDDNLIVLFAETARASEHADAAMITLVIINQNPVHHLLLKIVFDIDSRAALSKIPLHIVSAPLNGSAVNTTTGLDKKKDLGFTKV
jgi:hypothetical protein